MPVEVGKEVKPSLGLGLTSLVADPGRLRRPEGTGLARRFYSGSGLSVKPKPLEGFGETQQIHHGLALQQLLAHPNFLLLPLHAFSDYSLDFLGGYDHEPVTVSDNDVAGRNRYAANTTGTLTFPGWFLLVPLIERPRQNTGNPLSTMALPSRTAPLMTRSARPTCWAARVSTSPQGAFEQAPDLRYTPLFDDPFVAAVPANSSLGKHKTIRAAELNGMPLIQYPKDPLSGFAARMMALLRDAGVDCVAGHEAIEIHTALGLVAAGLGFTLVGRSVSDGNRSDIAFVPITGIKGTATIVAVTRKDDDSALAKSFVSALQGNLHT